VSSFPHRFDKALQRFGFPFGHVAFTLALTSPPENMSWDDMLDTMTLPAPEVTGEQPVR